MTKHIHDCVIAVNERGESVLLKSDPDLYEHDVFDGIFLADNVNKDEKIIPKDYGVYKCKIIVDHYSYWTDCGTEHDVNVYLEDIEKILG